MSSTLPLLILLFSFINIMYMQAMQYDLYDGFVSSPSILILVLAYVAWTGMAYILKKFVISDEKFGFKSAFTYAPLLGFVIYMCINVTVMNVAPDWPLSLAFTDVVFGSTMFSVVSLIAVVFKDLFD